MKALGSAVGWIFRDRFAHPSSVTSACGLRRRLGRLHRRSVVADFGVGEPGRCWGGPRPRGECLIRGRRTWPAIVRHGRRCAGPQCPFEDMGLAGTAFKGRLLFAANSGPETSTKHQSIACDRDHETEPMFCPHAAASRCAVHDQDVPGRVGRRTLQQSRPAQRRPEAVHLDQHRQ